MRDVVAHDIPGKLIDALERYNGEQGTLTLPAAFEDYARFGTPYDCRRSPVDKGQGVLSQTFATLPNVIRTYCPMCGVAGRGALASDICHHRTGSAFGTGSAWERLFEHDAQMLFLGVRPALAFTFVRFIQVRFGVPYLYNKLYTVPTFEDGVPVDLPITCAVRYLDADYRIIESCDAYERQLIDSGLLTRTRLGKSHAYLIPSARAAFALGTECLKGNLYFFLAAPPRWVPGRIPTDGDTGKYVSDGERFGGDA